MQLNICDCRHSVQFISFIKTSKTSKVRDLNVEPEEGRVLPWLRKAELANEPKSVSLKHAPLKSIDWIFFWSELVRDIYILPLSIFHKASFILSQDDWQ